MEVMYDKLVRDKIPQIIHEDGKQAITRKAKDNNHLRNLLIDKLFEEIEEYKESFEVEELADVLEIIHSLIEVVEKKEFEEIELMRKNKRKKRGGFEKGIILDRVIF